MTTYAASVTIVDLPVGTTVTGAELFEAVQTSSGVGQSVQLSLSQLLTLGGLPIGGATGTLLNKSSGANYSTQFSAINTFVNVISTTGLATTGSATSIIVGISAGGIGSTQLAASAVQRSNLTALAVGSSQIDVGGVLRGNIGAAAIGSSQLDTGAVLSGNLTASLSLVTPILGTASGSTLTLGTSVVAGTAALTVNGIASATKFQGDGSLLNGVVATTTLSSLIVLGSATLGSALVSGSLIASTTLSVLGTASFSGGIVATGTLGLVGTAVLTSTFTVVGTTLVAGPANFTAGNFGVFGTTLFTSGAFGVVGTATFTGTHGVIGTTLFTTNAFGVVGTSTFTTNAFGVVGTATFTSNAFGVNGTSNFTGTFILGSQATGVLVSSGTGVVTAQGGMVLLNTLVANNVTALSDTTSFSNAYSSYEIVLQNLSPQNNSVWLQMLFHSGGTFQSAGYTSSVTFLNQGGLGTSVGATTALQITENLAPHVGSAAGVGVTGFVKVYAPTSATTNAKGMTVQVTYPSTAGTFESLSGGGVWNNSAAVDGIQLLFNTGNLSTGTVKIYGLT